MNLSRYFLFKTPFFNNTVNVGIMIFDSTFLYYQLFNLLCRPALIVFHEDGLYLVSISSGNSGLLPLFALSFNPVIPSLPYLFNQSEAHGLLLFISFTT